MTKFQRLVKSDMPVTVTAPKPSDADIVLEQYRAVHGVLEQIFQLCPDTSWQADGVGQCTFDATALDEDETAVPDLRERRHARRLEANPDSWPLHTRQACWYHRPDHGCTLGDLKPPVCLGDTTKNVGLPPSYALLGDVPLFLNQLLDGHFFDHIRDPKPSSPAENWPRIREWLATAEMVLNDCRRAYLERTGKVSLDTL